jgi:acyl-CoA dehydrogenase
MNQYDPDIITMPVSPDWLDIRDAVGRLCEDFPNEYWLKLDKEEAYPHEFVKALTESGFLGALIPEEYGGSGLPLTAAGAVL